MTGVAFSFAKSKKVFLARNIDFGFLGAWTNPAGDD